MPDLRLSVPERAWLTSRSVESRRASRAAALGSGPDLAAGMVSPTFLRRESGVRRRRVQRKNRSSLGDVERRCTPPALRGACGGDVEIPVRTFLYLLGRHATKLSASWISRG